MAGVPQLTGEDHARLEDAIWRDDRSPGALHLAAAALLSADEKEGLRIVAYLESVAGEEDAQRSELARIPLRRAVHHPLPEIRSAAFRALMPHGAPEMVAPTMIAFLQADPAVLNPAGAEALSRRGLPEEVMAAVLAFVAQVHRARGARRSEPARGSAAPACRRGGLPFAAAGPAGGVPRPRRTAHAGAARVPRALRRGPSRLVQGGAAGAGPLVPLRRDPARARGGAARTR